MADVDPVNPDDLKGKVKVQWHNDPNKIKYVTPQAVEYLKPLWVLAGDQQLPEAIKKKSNPVVAPVVNQKAEDQKAEAIKKYLDAGGENPEHVNWTAPRLFIEAATLNKIKAQEKISQPKPEPEPVAETAPETAKADGSENHDKGQGKKRGRKAKTETATA